MAFVLVLQLQLHATSCIVTLMERKIEGAIIAIVFILVVGCFSIPIVIYATSSQDSTGDSVVIEILADQFNVNECSRQVCQ